MNRFFIYLTGVLLFAAVVVRGDTPPVVTVAVLNFAQTDDGSVHSPHAWMRKGLADLLINDLATSPALRILTREHMQMLLQESGLQQNLLRDVPDAEAAAMRHHFAVDRVLYGFFTVERDALILRVNVIRQEDGQVVARFSEEASVKEVLQAEKALARKLLAHFAGTTVAEAEAWPLPQWTDSTDATQRLYEGVDLFDGGDYLHAWHAFRQAMRVDPDFADAHYWAARMYYYRTEYAHARPDYERFIRRFPQHARVGDAVMELIHSAERLSDSPQEVLALYQTFQGREWQGVQVHNQADYLSRSPLSDWLSKREQGALAFLERYDEAYQALLLDLSVNASTNAADRAWQNQAKDLLAGLATLSEDSGGPRLMSDAAPYSDLTLTLEKPWFKEDLGPRNLKGFNYLWGQNYRILAPPGYRFKSLKAEIWRTNDPKLKSVCRLQIRRYRYVDINACWTQDNDQAADKRYLFDVTLPVNCTWFLLRPEFDGRSGNPRNTEEHSARFDAWRIDAEFEPLPSQTGGVELRVRNAMEFNAAVDGIYARCRNGVIGNLAPGQHTLRISDMYNRKVWGYEPLETTFEVHPGQYEELDLDLAFSEKSRQTGWADPAGVVCDYPTYKHSPRRLENWREGSPAFAVHRATGQRVVIWSHLDDLWLATSTNGVDWSQPVNLPAPVNSAHVELNPRLLVTESGRYALLFLSDRGLQRSLAAYICTSDDLRRWTRPAVISAEHHIDLSLVQARNGPAVLISVPAVKDTAYFEWRTSDDLVTWSAPQRIPVASRPQCMGLTQDATGLFHLVWLGEIRSTQMYVFRVNRVHHMTSRDLVHWSRPSLIPFDSPHVINVAPVVTENRLWCAIGTVDEQYSGQSRLVLYGRDLREAGADWMQWDVPEHTLSGLASLAVDPLNGYLTFCWAMTDMQLNTTRFSGPVFLMSGMPACANPVRSTMHPAIPLTLSAQHPGAAVVAPSLDARTALVLDTPAEDPTFAPQATMSDETYARRAGTWLKGLPAIATLAKAATQPAADAPSARRADAWYFGRPQRNKQLDRDIRVAFASAGHDDDITEHAWFRLREAGMDEPLVSLPSLAALALRRGRPAAADALLHSWQPAPDAEAALAAPSLRRRVALANGVWPTAALALSPPPSSLLDHLRVKNLMADLERAVPPFAISDGELSAVRTRRGFGIRASSTFAGTTRLFGTTPARDVAHVAMRVRFRVMNTFGTGGSCDILLTDEKAERAWEKTGRPEQAEGRQLGFHVDVRSDQHAEVGLIVNGDLLVSYDVPAFADRDHVLHLIQYDNRGEIFLDHRRAALVPITPRTRRPLFLIRAQRMEIAFTELDIWELTQ